MIRIPAAMSACLLLLAVGIVYIVKYQVRDIQREVSSMESQLRAERDALHVLRAEWAYLTRPQRVRALAEAHLDLAPLQGRQMVDDVVLSSLLWPHGRAQAEANIQHANKQGKARTLHDNQEYVTPVSMRR